MFCADAKPIPASSTAVLSRSLLLIGMVLSCLLLPRAPSDPAYEKLNKPPYGSRAAPLRREKFPSWFVNGCSSLHEQKLNIAWLPEFRGEQRVRRNSVLGTTATGRQP
jgi:hypothetical protein